ncbi:MAG: peptide-methionine (S)-S-oxide reductase MsrA [Gammaproteobacteria bacterium]|nr:peptide-methionine (S)-S-oxide reductase MsrA [Gammaproteobacteria bacterium]
MFQSLRKPTMVSPADALPGREQAMPVPPAHAVLGTPLTPPYPDGTDEIVLGLGCFWGAERLFWELDGVVTTAAGYAGGFTPNPTYEEVCSGRTGHAEVVRVVFDPQRVTLGRILKTFWEGHDPTQGFRQGNDVGTQYRSTIYATSPEQLKTARASADAYGAALAEHSRGQITTEIEPAGPFYFAEHFHQQYLEKNPGGYCGLGSTGVACQLPTGVQAA